MVKKILYVIVLLNIVGYLSLQLFAPLLYTVKSYEIKNEQQQKAKRLLQNNSNIQTLNFSFEEFSKCVLNEGKEIIFNGEYYEIISVAYESKLVHVKALIDKEETEWLEFSFRQINKFLKNSFGFVNLFISYGSFDTIEVLKITPTDFVRSYSLFSIQMNSSPLFEINTPPPNYKV